MDKENVIKALHEADILLGSLTADNLRFESELEDIKVYVSVALAEAQDRATAEDRAKLERALHPSAENYRRLD